MIYAYVSRSGEYAKKGDWDRAIADMNEAVRLEPNCLSTYMARASLYQQKGDTAKAKQDFARAKELEAQKAIQAQHNQPSYPQTGVTR